MKKAALILMMFGALTFEAFSQKRLPKNVSLSRPSTITRVETAVANKRTPDGWFEITATENNFKLSFPVPPQTSSFNTKSITPTFKQFYAQTPQVYYSASVTSIPIVIDDLERLNEIYDNVRNRIVDGTTFTLSSEKDVYSDKHVGRERLSKDRNDRYYTKNRTFIIGGELYELNAIVEKKFLESSRQNVEKFFASFGVIESLPSIAEAKVVPKNFNGFVKDNVYRNDFFGFNITLPNDWFISNSEEKLYVKEVGAMTMQTSDPERNAVIEKQNNRENILLMTTKQPLGVQSNSIIVIYAEPYFYNMVDERAVATATLKATLDNYGKSSTFSEPKIIRDVFEKNINGKRFAAFEIGGKFQESSFKQQLYFLKQKGYLLIFTLGYTDDKNFPDLENAINTTTFNAEK